MPETLQELLQELSEIEDSTEKLKFLISLASELPPFPEEARTAQNKIAGCASNAYITSECRDGKMIFRGDSDAQIPKGILALFLFGCEDASPSDIAQISPEQIQAIGFEHMLSPSRINGAYHIFHRIQQEAQKALSPEHASLS